MRKSTALLLALLPAAALQAQEAPDSSRVLAEKPALTYRPLYTLLRAAIERIPPPTSWSWSTAPSRS